MKRRERLPIAKDEAIREYYDRTSTLEQGRKLERVQMSFPRPRRLVALRLEEDTVAAIRKLAAEKGINYSTLMRMWITERLRQER